MQKTPLLLSFEGLEGSGKSTQIQLLVQHLKNQNIPTFVFREPGGTKFGESIREILLKDFHENEMSPLSEFLLFLSSRVQLLKEKIVPLLKKDQFQVIILDRFKHSSIAYQGAGRKLGEDLIIKYHDTYPLNLSPDYTFYLDIDVETSMERIKARGEKKDRIEKLPLEFFRLVRESYLKMNDSNFKKINASQNIDIIHNQILKYLNLEVFK